MTRSPRRYAASLEVMACVALVVSTIVAATVVSIGLARAAAATADSITSGFQPTSDANLRIGK